MALTSNQPHLIPQVHPKKRESKRERWRTPLVNRQWAPPLEQRTHTPESVMEKLIMASWGCISRAPPEQLVATADHETAHGIPIFGDGHTQVWRRKAVLNGTKAALKHLNTLRRKSLRTVKLCKTQWHQMDKIVVRFQVSKLTHRGIMCYSAILEGDTQRKHWCHVIAHCPAPLSTSR